MSFRVNGDDETLDVYVEGYTVVYGDSFSDMPKYAVVEVSGGNNDLNAGFGGKFVWIEPNWTTSPESAIGGLKVVTSDDSIPGLENLAQGTEGPYRYLVKEEPDDLKVIRLGLFRSDMAHKFPPAGWRGMSQDLNSGRGKSYLYVLWEYE